MEPTAKAECLAAIRLHPRNKYSAEFLRGKEFDSEDSRSFWKQRLPDNIRSKEVLFPLLLEWYGKWASREPNSIGVDKETGLSLFTSQTKSKFLLFMQLVWDDRISGKSIKCIVAIYSVLS